MPSACARAIEGHEPTRVTVRYLLEEAGYEVVEAATCPDTSCQKPAMPRSRTICKHKTAAVHHGWLVVQVAA